MNSIVIVSESDQLPLDRNPALVYIASLPSDNSRRVIRHSLQNLVNMMWDGEGKCPPLEIFPWWELRYQHTQAIRTRLMEEFAIASTNRHLSALRGVLKECWRLNLMDVDEYQRAVDIHNVKGTTKPAGRDISDGEMRRLLKSCYDDGIIGIRDIAALAVLVMTGMRRDEFNNLTLEDFHPETGALDIQKGKGRKARTVYIVKQARKLLDQWLEYRGEEAGPLFNRVYKSGRINIARPMSGQAAYNMLTERAKQVGLRHTTPHDLRRTFIGNMLDAGVDTVTLAKITGHESVDMLKRYDRRPERVKAEAQSKIDLPI